MPKARGFHGANSMNEAERLLIQRLIAAIIDHPSVYMGGPSRNSMRKAENIIESLERGKRLVPTTCDHRGWVRLELPVKHRGTYCPDCGSIIPDDELARLYKQETGESL